MTSFIIHDGVSVLNYIESIDEPVDCLFFEPTQENIELHSHLNNIRDYFPIQENASIVPNNVTARQMKKALALTNKLSTVESFVASLPEPQKTLVGIEWRESNEFHRNNTLLIQMSQMLGMTSEELDDIFTFAATL